MMVLMILMCVTTLAVVAAPAPLPSGPTYKEVVVGKATDLGGKEFVLRTNIYLPSGQQAGPTPFVLFIHGNGGAYNFSNGSRSYEFAIALKDRGIAVATADYRDMATGEQDVNDVKAYIRFFRAKAKEYNLDPNRFAVWGTSRGGHLAAMMATTGNMKEWEGDIGGNTEQSSAIQAAVIYYPIIDLLVVPPKGLPAMMIGAKDSDAEAIVAARDHKDTASPLWKYVEAAQKLNPISYVSPDDPPVLIACSAKDPVTPWPGAYALWQKYVEKGVDALLYGWSFGTHGVVGTDIEAATSEWLVKKLLVDLVQAK